MIVYRFKFDQDTADSGASAALLDFLLSVISNGDTFNYKPSKRDIIIGTQNSLCHILVPWIKENVNYSFEYEKHSDERRTLTQIKQDGGPVISVSYLIPLFSVESYLDL